MKDRIGIPGDDVKVCPRIGRAQLTGVKCNVEVQRVLAVSRYADVSGGVAKRLHLLREIQRHFGLVGPNKDAHLHTRFVFDKHVKVTRLHVFVID